MAGRRGRPGRRRRAATEVAARACAAIVRRRCRAARPGDALVVVTHGGSARAAIGTLLGLPIDHWAVVGGLANCCWSVLEETGQAGRLAAGRAQRRQPAGARDGRRGVSSAAGLGRFVLATGTR